MTAGLGQENVIERRLVQHKARQLKTDGIKRAHDSRELLDALVQANLDCAAIARHRLAETGENRLGLGVAGTIARGYFDAGPADLGLELRRSALGRDFSFIDDAHPVSQLIGFLEVLGGQKHGHSLIAGQTADFIPER